MREFQKGEVWKAPNGMMHRVSRSHGDDKVILHVLPCCRNVVADRKPGEGWRRVN